MSNCHMRFCNYNYATSDADITFSSENATYPASNASDVNRSRFWSPEGYFKITASNNVMKISDGTDWFITVPEGEYTGSELATAVETALNATSSGFTVSYNSTTFKFEFTSSGSRTLYLSYTTGTIWDELGFKRSTDIVSTSFTPDEVRLHSYEYYQVDHGTPLEVSGVIAICKIDEVFGLTGNAEVRFQGNNVDSWDNPPLDEVITLNDRGIFKFFNTDTTDTTYRYHRIKITDRLNPDGPSALKISNIYIGDATTIESSNVANGFSRSPEENTTTMTSEGGQKYFDTRPIYETFSSITFQNIDQDDRANIEQIYEDNGIHTPLFVTLDPLLAIDTDPSILTKYVYFGQKPSFNHIFGSYYAANLSLTEAL